ncbi:MAG: hypothetical protein OER86_08845 [Phycisphaerae bacterium]|nr:hypothetical protein [Phycisphaerae bacterium]
MTTPTHRHTTLLLLALLLGGCNYANEWNLPGMTTTGSRTPKGTAVPYPAEAPVGEPLDIEITRIDDAIRLDNRTVHSYSDAQLWLNSEYGALIDRIAVGRGDPLYLGSFLNRHGETYPLGRFLTPDKDKPLVLADLLIDGRLHKLTVRLGDDWQSP